MIFVIETNTIVTVVAIAVVIEIVVLLLIPPLQPILAVYLQLRLPVQLEESDVVVQGLAVVIVVDVGGGHPAYSLG
jgi:hypothetical protein